MYREYQPSQQLSPFVETYWLSEEYASENRLLKILPDGCMDILFSFCETTQANGLQVFASNIVGTTTSVLKVTYTGRFRMFSIRFKPAGIRSFIRAPDEQ